MSKKSPATEYMIRHDGRLFGPYGRADLEAGAREGKITGRDEICNAATKEWMPAHRVEWLKGPRGRRLRGPGAPGWIRAVAVLVLLAVAGGIGFVVLSKKADDVPETAGTTDPDPSTVVRTEPWGLVPPGRVNVRLVEGSMRAKADAVAEAIGGTVVDALPTIDLYLIDIPAATEAELRAALDLAAAQDGVAGAFPEQVAVLHMPGTRCTALDDPAYAGRLSRPQEIVGLQKAWDLVEATSHPLGKVKVGVIDTGLYKGQGEFNGAPAIETPGKRDELAKPNTGKNGKPLDWYSHGTAVMSVLVADEQNGGVAGYASPLGDKISVMVANKFYKGFKGLVSTPTPKPDALVDPKIVTDSVGSYFVANLRMMREQIDKGATVINCSWGNAWDEKKKKLTEAHPLIVKAYHDFYVKVAEEKPGVVFVCAAGNESTTPKPGTWVPGGFALANVITVGNVNTEGGVQGTSTNVMDKTTPKGKFMIDIAAPGHEVVHGIGPDGAVVASDGGTSMAAPQVAATIALMKSIDPQLTGKRIKEILTRTARAEILKSDGTKTKVPTSEVGGCLATDLAVLAAINARRERVGIASHLTMDFLLELARIDLEAKEDADGDWVITASVPRTRGDTPTTLTIRPEPSAGIAGATMQTAAAGEAVSWIVTPNGAAHVHVKRGDTDACWNVLIGGIKAMVKATPSSGVGTGQVPLVVKLSARGSESVNGRIKLYEWDLDDDGTIDLETTTQELSKPLELVRPGPHRVTVHITDEIDRKAFATTTIRVDVPTGAAREREIIRVRGLLKRALEHKESFLKRIRDTPQPRSEIPMPDIHKHDKAFIRDVIKPKIADLRRWLATLGG